MKCCVATVCSEDKFQWYIPMFIYSWKKAYPKVKVKVFLRGKLEPEIRAILNKMRTEKYCEGKWTVREDSFTDYPTRDSTCNTLRHLLPSKEFEGYELLYITDVDFITFRQTPSHFTYFNRIMKKTKMPYGGFRGPYTRPRRRKITKRWAGDFKRIADGTLMLKCPEWFQVTHEARKKYKKIGKKGCSDNYDNHKWASYREYNEVMLYRICKESHLPTPSKRYHFLNGEKYNYDYRDIHIGDFKNTKRKNSKGTMQRYLQGKNVRNFQKLEKDPHWREIVTVCIQNKHIRRMMKNVRLHTKKRL